MATNDDTGGTTKKPQMLAHYFSLAKRINRASSFFILLDSNSTEPYAGARDKSHNDSFVELS